MPIRSLLITGLLSASVLLGQRYNFKFYGEEEGLQSLAVQIVLQDREFGRETGAVEGAQRALIGRDRVGDAGAAGAGEVLHD